MELCACPECGAPAEVIQIENAEVRPTVPAPPAAEGAEAAAGAEAVAAEPAGDPAAEAPADAPGRPGEIVGVRCVRRHWFLGLRERLVA